MHTEFEKHEFKLHSKYILQKHQYGKNIFEVAWERALVLITVFKQGMAINKLIY